MLKVVPHFLLTPVFCIMYMSICRLKYLLVVVDVFSKVTGSEDFTCNREDANIMVKILVREIIPTWDCPLQISSDNGPASSSKVCQELVRQ